MKQMRTKRIMQPVAGLPSNCRELLQQFDTLEVLANELGISSSAVSKWYQRGSIPAHRHEDVKRACGKHGIAFDQDSLTDAP